MMEQDPTGKTQKPETKGNKPKATGVYFSPDQEEFLRTEAALFRVPVSELLRHIVDVYRELPSVKERDADRQVIIDARQRARERHNSPDLTSKPPF